MHPLLIEIGKVCLIVLRILVAMSLVVFFLMLYAYTKAWLNGDLPQDFVDSPYKKKK